MKFIVEKAHGGPNEPEWRTIWQAKTLREAETHASAAIRRSSRMVQVRILLVAALSLLTGCGAQVGAADSCSPPQHATYTVTSVPRSREGCQGVTDRTYELDENLVVDGCFARLNDGVSHGSIGFDEGWNEGVGSYTQDHCVFDVHMVRQ